jgi:hypothetical protein
VPRRRVGQDRWDQLGIATGQVEEVRGRDPAGQRSVLGRSRVDHERGLDPHRSSDARRQPFECARPEGCSGSRPVCRSGGRHEDDAHGLIRTSSA